MIGGIPPTDLTNSRYVKTQTVTLSQAPLENIIEEMKRSVLWVSSCVFLWWKWNLGCRYRWRLQLNPQSISTHLNLPIEIDSYGCVHKEWQLNPYDSSEAIFHIDPGWLMLSFSFQRASLHVAATTGPSNQKRRKLEIRSSSHKSLQSPKGP